MGHAHADQVGFGSRDSGVGAVTRQPSSAAPLQATPAAACGSPPRRSAGCGRGARPGEPVRRPNRGRQRAERDQPREPRPWPGRVGERRVEQLPRDPPCLRSHLDDPFRQAVGHEARDIRGAGQDQWVGNSQQPRGLRRLLAVSILLLGREGGDEALVCQRDRIEQRGVHPAQQFGIGGGVGRAGLVATHGVGQSSVHALVNRVDARGRPLALRLVAERQRDIAPTVECSRCRRAHREPENPLCSATPAATIGWASWSRIARPHRARRRAHG